MTKYKNSYFTVCLQNEKIVHGDSHHGIIDVWDALALNEYSSKEQALFELPSIAKQLGLKKLSPIQTFPNNMKCEKCGIHIDPTLSGYQAIRISEEIITDDDTVEVLRDIDLAFICLGC